MIAMTLDELLNFCEKNDVSITIHYDRYHNAVRVSLRDGDGFFSEQLVERGCCESVKNKNEHFQHVLCYLIEEMNGYRNAQFAVEKFGASNAQKRNRR